ncbi:MAG: DNA alkylation repair protein [Verrucomicrobiae bacterium]|nr:DNA alkylation repair protein [Verrucomicrobiae bacterium]
MKPDRTASGSKPGLRLPAAPRSIARGSTLRALLDLEAIACLAHNLAWVHPRFDYRTFQRDAATGLAPLGIMERGNHLAHVLRRHLPTVYEEAIAVLTASLTPPLQRTDDLGLGGFFHLPHVCFVATYGLDPGYNAGRDPFDTSMGAQYELTRRFSAEFSIRHFLVRWPERTLARLIEWTRDPDPHVRRLCSEGSRPRLPWAIRLTAFQQDPRPVLPILEALKDDPDLYVRRSVANHVGDIAKDHPQLALELCDRWMKDAPPERRWLIRHALRYPAKHGVREALRLRRLAAR